MKKISLLLATLFFLLSAAFSQTKITKAGIIGKWELSVIETKGMMYYDIDKDSIRIAEQFDSTIKDPKQKAIAISQFKTQMALLYKSMSFTFNENGTCNFFLQQEEDMDNEPEVTYKVDEVNSTITILQKDKKTETIKAEMLGSKLKLIMSFTEMDDNVPMGGSGYFILRRSSK